MTPIQRRVPGDDHTFYDELAVGWALHALEPEDEDVFAQHLPGCSRCARTVAETAEVMAAMAADLPRAEPSAELRDRLSAAVAETEQVQPPAEEEPAEPTATGFPRYRGADPDQHGSSPLRRRLPAMALVAAAVLVILGLGIWNVFLADARDDLRATVAQQERIVNQLLTPGPAKVAALSSPTSGEVVATVVARSDRVDVVSYGLSANNPDSQTYVVWGLDGNDATALGTFDVSGSQIELETVGSGETGLDEYALYGISIEPGQVAPQAPTDIVATG